MNKNLINLKEMQEFFPNLTEEELSCLVEMKMIILETDNKVEERIGHIMSVDKAIVFEEQGVFKYGLAANKSHISFHSMVMYANPDLKNFLERQKLTKIKLSKGCINFSSPMDFPRSVFYEFIVLSAKKDFSPVVNYYKSKK